MANFWPIIFIQGGVFRRILCRCSACFGVMSKIKHFSLVLVDFNCMEREKKLFKNLISHANSRYVVVLSSMDLSPEKAAEGFLV